MVNKKGIETMTIVELIAAVIVLGVLALLFLQYQRGIEASSNKEAVRAWTTQRVLEQDVKEGLGPVGRPPVAQLGEKPVYINTRDDLVKANGMLADDMVDCWDAFLRGKDFLGKRSEGVFCFPCYTVSFSKELKENQNYQIRGFQNYLATQKPVPGPDKQTYAEILRGRNTCVKSFTPPPLEEDLIPVHEDLYIYYIATTSSTWEKMVIAAGAGATTFGTIGTLIVPGWGTVIGGALGGIGGAATVAFVDEPTFCPAVTLGQAEPINKYCNQDF